MLPWSCLKSLPFLSLGFTAIFLYQLTHLVSDYLQPSELNTVMEVDQLDQLGKFPLIFQICVRPGLNMTELKHFGYGDIDSYFWGITRGSNDSDVGWDGKDASISPAGITLLLKAVSVQLENCRHFQTIYLLGDF